MVDLAALEGSGQPLSFCWAAVASDVIGAMLVAIPLLDTTVDAVAASRAVSQLLLPLLICCFLGCCALSEGAEAGLVARALRAPVLSKLGGYTFAVYLWQARAAPCRLAPTAPLIALASRRSLTSHPPRRCPGQEPVFRLLILLQGCDETDDKEGALMLVFCTYAFAIFWTEIVELPVTEWLRARVDPFLKEPAVA